LCTGERNMYFIGTDKEPLESDKGFVTHDAYQCSAPSTITSCWSVTVGQESKTELAIEALQDSEILWPMPVHNISDVLK